MKETRLLACDPGQPIPIGSSFEYAKTMVDYLTLDMLPLPRTLVYTEKHGVDVGPLEPKPTLRPYKVSQFAMHQSGLDEDGVMKAVETLLESDPPMFLKLVYNTEKWNVVKTQIVVPDAQREALFRFEPPMDTFSRPNHYCPSEDGGVFDVSVESVVKTESIGDLPPWKRRVDELIKNGRGVHPCVIERTLAYRTERALNVLNHYTPGQTVAVVEEGACALRTLWDALSARANTLNLTL